MDLKGLKTFLQKLGFCHLLFLLLFTALTGAVFGQQAPTEGVDFPAYYPERFDGMGRINRIGRYQVVIDDSLFQLSPHLTCATPTTQHASRAFFGRGQFVGYKTNPRHVITSIWLIE